MMHLHRFWREWGEKRGLRDDNSMRPVNRESLSAHYSTSNDRKGATLSHRARLDQPPSRVGESNSHVIDIYMAARTLDQNSVRDFRERQR